VKLLVTGGAGYSGGVVVAQLVAAGEAVDAAIGRARAARPGTTARRGRP
jgi:nucleoside-diphosphate-sugar epimerase